MTIDEIEKDAQRANRLSHSIDAADVRALAVATLKLVAVARAADQLADAAYRDSAQTPCIDDCMFLWKQMDDALSAITVPPPRSSHD